MKSKAVDFVMLVGLCFVSIFFLWSNDREDLNLQNWCQTLHIHTGGSKMCGRKEELKTGGKMKMAKELRC